ncbi:MAG: OmpA family protein [Bacteroidota bacterium]|nr:OmpA family protein [Bacteroidota bacterium]
MKKHKLLLFTMMLCMVSTFVSAQTEDNKWGLSMGFGKNEYKGDLGNGLFDFDQDFNAFGSLGLFRYLNHSFDLGGRFSWGSYGYKSDLKHVPSHFFGHKTDYSLMLNYKLNNGCILPAKAKLQPYLTIGLGGATYYGPSIYKTSITDFIVPMGAGLKYNFNSWFAVQYLFLYTPTNHDVHDGWWKGKHDRYFQNEIGLVFSFGKKKDSDGDGVADKYDRCPGTPKGVTVDARGCPIDSDGDGVPDYLDKCPGTPQGVAVDANGCPLDSDGDGVPDYLDKCPNTPPGVKVNASGCPLDSDGDGVPDYLDKCPDTPHGVAVGKNGCPLDSDGDGVPDYLDKCPGTPKGVTVDAKGCPLDSDGDGVPDYLDKCPKVKGLKSNNGCPEVKATAKKIFAKALTGIQFETGKDIIKPASFPILNQVVAVMNEDPEYNLEINGHTDNIGTPAHNMILSQKRADAVKAYLVKKGINAGRLKAQGFGQTQPVADNSTAAGKAKNRRVEFKVVF